MAKKQRAKSDKAVSGSELDAIQLLESQHREVERLFQTIGTAGNGDGKEIRATVTQIIDKLTLHSAIEERHFYPAARASDTEELIDDSYEDHRELKEVCLHLLDVGPDDADYQAKVEELQGLVEEHVAIEESELFPMVRDLVEDSALQSLAEEMVATMTELEQEGPTRDRLAADLGESARA